MGMTTARSEKWYKIEWHRRWRRRIRAALNDGDELMPHHYEVSDPWLAPKDGQQHWWDCRAPWRETYGEKRPWKWWGK